MTLVAARTYRLIFASFGADSQESGFCILHPTSKSILLSTCPSCCWRPFLLGPIQNLQNLALFYSANQIGTLGSQGVLKDLAALYMVKHVRMAVKSHCMRTLYLFMRT